MWKIGFLLLAILSINQAKGQQLKGQVIDAVTGEPLLFATVFFDGTTTGAITDSEGKFNIFGFASGKYNLAVTYVGYQDYYSPIEFQAGEVREIVIELGQDLVVLPDFYLNADTSGWRQNFRIFKNNFIGNTSNSKKVEIIDPRKIFLYFDVEERTLFAHAKDWIEIQNDALGYDVSYSLREFSLNFNTGERYLFGLTWFTEQEPKNKRESSRWEKARLEAYNGSMQHFFRALKTNKFQENEFVVEELFRIPNPERLPDSIINRNIAKYRSQMFGDTKDENGQIVISMDVNGFSSTGNMSDSLRYWSRMRSKPKVIDSVGMQLRDNRKLIPNDPDKLIYQGWLRVVYGGEKEELGYTLITRQAQKDEQSSTIHFQDGSLKIHDNGYYEDVRSVFVEGYWSWSLGLAELLPLDYQPPSVRNK